MMMIRNDNNKNSLSVSPPLPRELNWYDVDGVARAAALHRGYLGLKYIYRSHGASNTLVLRVPLSPASPPLSPADHSVAGEKGSGGGSGSGISISGGGDGLLWLCEIPAGSTGKGLAAYPSYMGRLAEAARVSVVRESAGAGAGSVASGKSRCKVVVCVCVCVCMCVCVLHIGAMSCLCI